MAEKPSAIWYLLPILFGIIGAIIAYFVLKSRSPKMAKNCLIIGIVLSIIGIAISFAASLL